MRCQSEFKVSFYEGSPFVYDENAPLARVLLPTVPAVGTLMRFEPSKRPYRVAAVAWIDTQGQFIVRVFLDRTDI